MSRSSLENERSANVISRSNNDNGKPGVNQLRLISGYIIVKSRSVQGQGQVQGRVKAISRSSHYSVSPVLGQLRSKSG